MATAITGQDWSDTNIMHRALTYPHPHPWCISRRICANLTGRLWPGWGCPNPCTGQLRPWAPKVFDPRYTAIALCAFGLNDFKPNWVSVRLQSSISEKPYNKVVYSFSLHHSRIVPRSPSNKWELKIPKSQNFFDNALTIYLLSYQNASKSETIVTSNHIMQNLVGVE